MCGGSTPTIRGPQTVGLRWRPSLLARIINRTLRCLCHLVDRETTKGKLSPSARRCEYCRNYPPVLGTTTTEDMTERVKTQLYHLSPHGLEPIGVVDGLLNATSYRPVISKSGWMKPNIALSTALASPTSLPSIRTPALIYYGTDEFPDALPERAA